MDIVGSEVIYKALQKFLHTKILRIKHFYIKPLYIESLYIEPPYIEPLCVKSSCKASCKAPYNDLCRIKTVVLQHMQRRNNKLKRLKFNNAVLLIAVNLL